MKIKNIKAALKDQMPLKRFLINLITGRIKALISKRSHLNANGIPKIAYGSRKSALKASKSMEKKYGNYYATYKCLYCDGFHIGKNTQSV